MITRAITAIAIVSLLGINGCFYSFTGASVPPHLKTIAIPLLDDQSGSGVQALREQLTNKLIERFRRDNSLEVADRSNADSILEGVIVSLVDQAQTVTTGETVASRRVTVTAKVTFQDMKLRKKVWEKQFSGWGDYESSGGSPQQQIAIDVATEKLAEDILLNTVSGW